MAMRFKHILKSEQGLSMLEIIVAISVISIVFFGLMNVFPLGLSITGSAENETVAAFLVQEKVELLRSEDYDNIGEGTIEGKHRLSLAEDDYRYNYWRETEVKNVDKDLNETASSTGLKKITSVVYYMDDLTKKEESYSITTLISE